MKIIRNTKLAFALVAVVALVCAFALAGCGSSSSDKITVTMDVDVSALTEAGIDVDADLFDGSVEIDKGGTVYDALVASGVDFKLDDNNFITSICGVEQGQTGSWSGWLYTVNDLDPMTDIVDVCQDYVLNDGDAVHWIYAVSM